MADIVERLRSTELQNWALDKEAADEIERLRKERSDDTQNSMGKLHDSGGV